MYKVQVDEVIKFKGMFMTFKGDRKKANRGVFKLLRLKSSRSLRQYRRRPSTRVQRCSRCKQVGHNATSKRCLWLQVNPVDDSAVEDMAVDDRAVEDADVNSNQEADDVPDENVNEVSLNASTLDDLLESSDDELF